MYKLNYHKLTVFICRRSASDCRADANISTSLSDRGVTVHKNQQKERNAKEIS